MKKLGSWYLPDNEWHFVNNMQETGEDGYQTMHRGTILRAYKKLQDYDTRLAIDIGANVGFWTRDFCEQFDNVIAYEPIPSNLECLEVNCNKENLTIVDKALSDQNGTTSMWTDGQSGSASMYRKHFEKAEQVEVETRCLDDEIINLSDEQLRNCLIKIDVQGHEKSVLDGAEMLMKNHGPAICIEIRASDAVAKPWIKWFRKRNYILFEQFKKEHLFIPKGRNNTRT